MISYDDRKRLIESDNQAISISKQYELLQINRSGFYYKGLGESQETIDLMNHIDKFHSQDPTLGSRRICELLLAKKPANKSLQPCLGDRYYLYSDEKRVYVHDCHY